MGTLKWTGRTTTVGVLAISFKSGGSRQLIRYVQLLDVRALQGILRSNAEQETRVAEIRRLIESLRRTGYTDAQITVALQGKTPAQFEQMATTQLDFPVTSYQIAEDPLFDLPRLIRARTHTLKPHDFSAVELRGPQTVQGTY